MKFDRRLATLTGLVLVLLAGLLALWTRLPSSGDEPGTVFPPDAPTGSPDELERGALEPGGAASGGPGRDESGARGTSPQDPDPVEHAVEVVDASFGFRLSGTRRVGPGGEPALFHGEVRWRAEPGDVPTLRLEACGYRPIEVGPEDPAVAAGAVRMEPRLLGTVRVVDVDGAAVPGVEVVWSDGPGPPSLDAWPKPSDRAPRPTAEPVAPGVRVDTDETGTSSLGLGRVAHATVRFVPDGVPYRFVVHPGQVVECRRPLGWHDIVLRGIDDDSTSPVRHMRVQSCREATRPGEWRAVPESGVVRVAVDGGPIRMELDIDGRFDPEPVPGVRVLDAHSALLVEPAPGERTVVRVAPQGTRVLLVDRSTGEPIDASVTMSTRTLQLGTHHRRTAHRYIECVAGRIRLPDGVLRMLEPTESVVLRPEGYHERRFDDPHALLDPRDPPQVVEFDPAVGKVLRLVDRAGSPVALPVDVRWGEDEEVLDSLPARPDGRHELYWPGAGDLVLTSPAQDRGSRSSNPLRRTADLELGVVPAAELAARDEVTLQVDWACGLLRVECDADHAGDLVARRLRGELELRPTRWEDGNAIFDAVPPGHYCVGSPQWVRGVDPIVFDGSPGEPAVFVAEGAATMVPWNPDWWLEAPIRGVVHVRGSAVGRPYLVPIYGSTEVRHLVGWSSPVRELSGSGHYDFPVGAARPELVLLLTGPEVEPGLGDPDDRLRLLASGLPGTDLQVNLSTVRLVWDGGEAPARPVVQVEARLPPERLHPGTTRVTGSLFERLRASWRVAGPWEMRGVDSRVRELRFRIGRVTWTQDVDLEPGGTTEVRVRPPH